MRNEDMACNCEQGHDKKMPSEIRGKDTTHIRTRKTTVLALDNMGKYINTNYAKELKAAGISTLVTADVIEFAVERAMLYLTFLEDNHSPILIQSRIGKAIMYKVADELKESA
jgi:hypothetical protein